MTHEDAIKKVRKMSLPKETMEILEALIPELKESEDERIRKGLIEALKTTKNIGELKFILPEPTREECIAYLEKQKEPLPIPNKFSGLKSLMLQYLQSAANRKNDAEIEDDTDLWGRKILDYVWKQDEKQKEQKHPNGCFTCDEYKKGYEAGRLNGFTAGYNKAMKEIDQKEQKPWKVGANAYFTPEQKPTDRFKEAREKYQVEWNEEDEKMRNLIVAIFEVNHQDGFFKANELSTIDMRGVHTEEIISWLKSLRPQPHWKPSKEEIDAFENLLKGEFPNKIFPGTTLANLLNKLKKLYYNEAIQVWKPSEEQN